MAKRNKILITGASAGLGKEMARQMATPDRSFALAARSLDKLQETADQLRPQVRSVAIAQLDVADTQAVRPAFRQLVDEMGGVDRVIVNAGIGKGAPLGTGHLDANIETIQTNLVGALAQVEAAMEIFRAQNRGHLVLISSMSSVRGMPKFQTAYSASKAGLTAIGQGLQAELAKSPIKVTVILPGYIATAINKDVKTSMMADLEPGVRAMVKAIEAERQNAPVPSWPWSLVNAVLRYGPVNLTRRLVS